ncbi:MAG: hypothetical protein LBR88_09165, partial [Zoogloeaceae bacterium]|nr:hypothetical protein [Zoogloeaceae bacterium]
RHWKTNIQWGAGYNDGKGSTSDAIYRLLNSPEYGLEALLPILENPLFQQMESSLSLRFSYGTATDETLQGGTARDMLMGRAGNDALCFARGDGQDTIYDYDMTAGNRDSVQFGTDIDAQALWFARQGNDLTVHLLYGQQEKISIPNWFVDTAHQVEEFKLSDGSLLQSTQVQALVDAMANMEPQAIEEADLSEELLQIIGSCWELPEPGF